MVVTDSIRHTRCAEGLRGRMEEDQGVAGVHVLPIEETLMWWTILIVYVAVAAVRWIYLMWEFTVPITNRHVMDYVASGLFAVCLAALWPLDFARTILRE